MGTHNQIIALRRKKQTNTQKQNKQQKQNKNKNKNKQNKRNKQTNKNINFDLGPAIAIRHPVWQYFEIFQYTSV